MIERDYKDASEIEQHINYLAIDGETTGKFFILAMCLLDEMEHQHGIDSWQAATCREIFRLVKSNNDWKERLYSEYEKSSKLKGRTRELCAQIRALGGKVK